jgi:hypothetical protein
MSNIDQWLTREHGMLTPSQLADRQQQLRVFECSNCGQVYGRPADDPIKSAR